VEGSGQLQLALLCELCRRQLGTASQPCWRLRKLQLRQQCRSLVEVDERAGICLVCSCEGDFGVPTRPHHPACNHHNLCRSLPLACTPTASLSPKTSSRSVRGPEAGSPSPASPLSVARTPTVSTPDSAPASPAPVGFGDGSGVASPRAAVHLQQKLPNLLSKHGSTRAAKTKRRLVPVTLVKPGRRPRSTRGMAKLGTAKSLRCSCTSPQAEDVPPPATEDAEAQAKAHEAALKRDGRTGSKRLVDPKATRLAPFQKVRQLLLTRLAAAKRCFHSCVWCLAAADQCKSIE
jgi:hypothetical protein